MKIASSLTALLDATRPDTATLLRRLESGQRLSASVISVPRSGVAQLQIGLTALLARTRMPLQPGMQLELVVTRLKPLPELKVLLSPQLTRPADQLLKTALPLQVPPKQTFSQLADARMANRELGAALPKEVQSILRQLSARPLTPLQLTAPALRSQLQTSGLFLEQSLARGSTPATGDLKLDFLRLLRLVQPLSRQGDSSGTGPTSPLASLTGSPPGALQTLLKDILQGRAQTPPGEAQSRSPLPQSLDRLAGLFEQLSRIAEGALARIQTQQAASLPQDQGPRQTWQFDLPLLIGSQTEAVQLRIERDTQNDQENRSVEACWSVMLRFDFEATGTIQARIVLNGESVASTFWCERADTERRVGEALSVLETAFRDTGLEVGKLVSIHGEPPEPVELPKPANNLVDAHA